MNYFHAAIDVDAADIKALFRRCQALEKLGKLDMAFKDVQRCATLEPKNKTFLETLRRLGADIQAKVSFKIVAVHQSIQDTANIVLIIAQHYHLYPYCQ